MKFEYGSIPEESYLGFRQSFSSAVFIVRRSVKEQKNVGVMENSRGDRAIGIDLMPLIDALQSGKAKNRQVREDFDPFASYRKDPDYNL